MNIKGEFLVRFYGTLPEDGQAADDAFDEMGDRVLMLLNQAWVQDVGIINESFQIVTGTSEEAST